MANFSLKYFDDTHMSLWYKGLIHDSITDKLIDIVEADESTGKSKKKISFLMAESFQNIVRHGLKDNEETIAGFFGVTNRSDVMSIFSSNKIEQKEGAILSENFEHINGLDKDELKAMYRQILTEGPMSEKGGAGLGLIEMARKSGKPIQYHFEDNGDTSEFAMQLNKPLNKDVVIETDINEGVELYKQFKAKGVLLFFKGDFDKETTNNIVQMLSKNTEHNKSLKKLIFHVGVELLQNLNRHSLSANDRRTGTFSISHIDEKITITTSNYVSESSKTKLENHISNLQIKTKAELRELYKNALKSIVLNNDSTQGIGLIDIARYGANMTCCFQDTSFGIQAEITATLEE